MCRERQLWQKLGGFLPCKREVAEAFAAKFDELRASKVSRFHGEHRAERLYAQTVTSRNREGHQQRLGNIYRASEAQACLAALRQLLVNHSSRKPGRAKHTAPRFPVQCGCAVFLVARSDSLGFKKNPKPSNPKTVRLRPLQPQVLAKERCPCSEAGML